MPGQLQVLDLYQAIFAVLSDINEIRVDYGTMPSRLHENEKMKYEIIGTMLSMGCCGEICTFFCGLLRGRST